MTRRRGNLLDWRIPFPGIWLTARGVSFTGSATGRSVVRAAGIAGPLLLTSLIALAQTVGTKPIYDLKLRPGQRATFVEGTVGPSRGQGDMTNSGTERYLLRVRAGQFLVIEIGSENDRAVFSLVKCSHNMVRYEQIDKAEGVKRWSGRLTRSGNYLVTIFTRDREADSRFKLRVTLH